MNVKKLIRMLATTASILLLPLCATQASNSNNDAADTDMEKALVNSGFKVRPATTSSQRAQLRRLPDSQFEEVKQNGNTYYVYADKKDGRLYVGDHWAYQAYQGYLKNKKLRKDGAFVWEVHPGDKANNKTIEVWNGYPPFRDW
jgi:hypothetical protein